MFNKPSGYISSNIDPYQPTIMEFFPKEYQDLIIVGRLDKDTEGLIIITNDGDFAHKLTSPNSNINKTYYKN